MGLTHVSFLIRKSSDLWLCAPTRSLSQLITSFIGSWCQGIHHAPFVAWPIMFLYETKLLQRIFFLACCIYTNNILCAIFKEHFELPLWSLKIEQISYWPSLKKKIKFDFFIITSQTSCLLDFSIERRWSSRRFSYGYLVTTSPQSLTLP